MTEQQGEHAHELYVVISDSILEVMDQLLRDEDPEVTLRVVERLDDEFRFWRFNHA